MITLKVTRVRHVVPLAIGSLRITGTFMGDGGLYLFLGWVKRLFGSFERRLNDVNDGVVVWRVNDRLKCAP